jgi:acetyltransferase AlgX (SGNH hydrolase-like protein)
MTLRRVAFRVLAVLLAIVVALAAAEIAVRLLSPKTTAFAGRRLYCSDSDVGHRLRPGSVTASGERISSAGFRDREFPETKPAGGFRVMAIGDSFTFGAVALADVFPKVLERRLAESFPGRPIEVIDAGVPCYDTEHEIHHFEKFGTRFHPDLVVLGFFVGNDVLENAKTFFMNVVDGELTTEYYVPSTLDRWLMHSQLYRCLRRSKMKQAKAAGPPGPLVASLRPPSLGNAFLAIEATRLGVCRIEPSKTFVEGWTRTERLLAELRDRLRRDGIDLIVLIVPDELQVDAALFRQIVDAKNLRAEDFDLDLPQRRLREFAAREGIATVDPLPELRARTAAGERFYIPEDTHWNPDGNRLAAEALLGPVVERARRALTPRDAR